jgi:predicted lactoylglutathione lyase
MTQPDNPRQTLPFSLLTLGVADVDRSAAFYVAVGFDRPPGPEGLVLLRTVGTVIALHPLAELLAETRLPAAGPGYRGVTMASNQPGRDEVDTAFARWVAAGGTAVLPPAATSWGGYAGQVADPDGHLWELAHNPFLELPAGGGFVVRPPD